MIFMYFGIFFFLQVKLFCKNFQCRFTFTLIYISLVITFIITQRSVKENIKLVFIYRFDFSIDKISKLAHAKKKHSRKNKRSIKARSKI